MTKFEMMDTLLKENNGYLKTSDVVLAGISKTHLSEYVRKRNLERVAHGLYMSQDAWTDEMYVIQVRYPGAVFSHETALYLLNLADREPLEYTVTMRSGTNATRLTNSGVKVYKIREEMHEVGATTVLSPAGHMLRIYNRERTLCDLIRSRSSVEIQDFQTAMKEYVRLKEKNIPLLMRYAKLLSVEKILKQYLEVLL